MTHDEMIAVIQHHKKGGKVQYRNKEQGPRWYDSGCPAWNFFIFDYRIKPEPVEMWGVEISTGHILVYRNKDVAEDVMCDHTGARMFKMREVED